MLRQERIPLTLLAVSWILTALYWSHLPASVPIHWGLSGQPDQWMPLPWGGVFGALMSTFIYLVYFAIPRIDPRKEHWKDFKKSYEFIKNATLGFAAFLTYLTLSTAVRGGAISVSSLLFGLGALYLVMGNYLPKLRSNFFIGIRTPWTLSSEEVWYRTHRLAGKLMTFLGCLMFLAAFAPLYWQIALVFGSLLLFSGWTIGYSFWLFNKKQG